jgi:hypothetical protein
MSEKFPNVIAAVEAREAHLLDAESGDLWKIGDALLLDIGPITKGRHQLAVKQKLAACATEIKRRGYKSPHYASGRLATIRQIAGAFSRDQRHRDLSFETHREAGNADFLDWVTEVKGSDISKRDVVALKKQWQQIDHARREAAHRKALEDAKNAPTPAARKKAKDKADDTRPMPKPGKDKPSKRDEHAMRILSEHMGIENAFEGATLKMQEGFDRLRKLKRVDEVYSEGYIEEADKAIKIAEQIKQYLKPKRLTVIEGSKQSA